MKVCSNVRSRVADADAGRQPPGSAFSGPIWSDRLAWRSVSLAIAAVVAAPVLSLGVLALRRSDAWSHLIATVLPASTATTVGLMAGVAAATLVTGASTAWLVTMYRFPGRSLFTWALLLPMAMPTYIVAFCYLELFDYAGSFQTGLRVLFGWKTAQDYWFPNVRTPGGAIFIMSAVLYPYVYLTARASFLQQSSCALEVSRTLGRTGWGSFIAVALPLARRALAAGVALALMETLNDIGAVQLLGVRTLTATVYETWLERNDLAGAAQLACVMLIFVFGLIWIEASMSSRRRFHQSTGAHRDTPEEALSGWSKAGAMSLCAFPILLGFGIPAGVLASSAFKRLDADMTTAFWAQAANSVLLAVSAAMLALVLALTLAYGLRVTGDGWVRNAVRISGIGYAVPGTVLAVGLLTPLATFDNAVDSLSTSLFGLSTGLILSGSLFAIILAHVIRFLAIALGNVEAGFAKATPNLDSAARTLGASALETLRRVHIPMLRPALGAAALLVFVDSMKELPATLLLRPFNFETLSTQVYALASLEQFEDASLPALMIVAVGLAPMILIHKTLVRRRSRPGAASSTPPHG